MLVTLIGANMTHRVLPCPTDSFSPERGILTFYLFWFVCARRARVRVRVCFDF